MNHVGGTLLVRGKDRFDLGRNAAQASGTRVNAIIKALSRWARANPRVMDASSAGSTPVLLSGTRREIEGASLALGIAFDDLLAARRLFEMLAQPGCTNFGARGKATEDGSTILSWNFDIPPFFRVLMGKFPLFVRELDGTIPYLCFGVPALVGMGVMNVEGLACVINAVGLTDDGEGLSSFELNNKAMETCSTVAQAAKVYEDGPRGAIQAMTVGLLMNFNTIWTDRERNLSVFEYSHNHFKREEAGASDSIASANHHQFLDRALTGSFDPSAQELIGGSYSRLGRMYALLDEYHGRIGPETTKLIVSDHMPDYSLLEEFGIKREWWQEKIDDSTICAHPWNIRKHLARGRFGDAFFEMGFSTTVYSMQYQPEQMTSWFTCGHPCRNDAVPIYWGNLLGSSAQRYPGAMEPHEIGTSKRQTSLRSVFHGGRSGYEGLLGRLWMWFTRTAEKPNFK